MSLVERFLSHPEKVHVTFDQGNGYTQAYPGTRLLEEAAGLALHLRALGVVPGDRVAVVAPTSEPLLRTIVGSWFARAGIVVLPHRLGGARSACSGEKLRRMLCKVEPRVVIGHADAEDAIRAALGPAQHYIPSESLHEIGSAHADSILVPLPEDLALLQFSSGSTREPRAVIVRHGQLTNAVDTSSESAMSGGPETIVSWLPAYHDFGFSAIPWALGSGSHLVAIPTERFLEDPLLWLRSISNHKGTLAACPPFALDLIARLASRAKGIRLDSLKYVWCAAEPIFSRRLHAAIESLRPAGLAPNVIQPSYGLAEAVIGVTVGDRGAKIRTRDSEGRSVVCCGKPVRNMEIRVTDSEGNQRADGCRGRIWIKGPSVTEGYWGEADSPLQNGWLDTGDEGFILDSELYVCGRSKDTLIRGGVNYDAHEIEDAVLDVVNRHLTNLRCRAAAVFAVRDDSQQRERAVAVLDVKHLPEDRDAAFNAIRASVLESTGLGLDDIGYARPPGLPRTTSGKLQRSAAREHYLAGDYA